MPLCNRRSKASSLWLSSCLHRCGPWCRCFGFCRHTNWWDSKNTAESAGYFLMQMQNAIKLLTWIFQGWREPVMIWHHLWQEQEAQLWGFHCCHIKVYHWLVYLQLTVVDCCITGKNSKGLVRFLLISLQTHTQDFWTSCFFHILQNNLIYLRRSQTVFKCRAIIKFNNLKLKHTQWQVLHMKIYLKYNTNLHLTNESNKRTYLEEGCNVSLRDSLVYICSTAAPQRINASPVDQNQVIKS